MNGNLYALGGLILALQGVVLVLFVWLSHRGWEQAQQIRQLRRTVASLCDEVDQLRGMRVRRD